MTPEQNSTSLKADPASVLLDRWLGIVYAMAVANGIDKIATALFWEGTSKAWVLAPLGLVALTIAIADWTLYYGSLVNKERSVSHNVLDAVFPVVIFLLFASAKSVVWFSAFVAVYFALAACYWMMLKLKGHPAGGWAMAWNVFGAFAGLLLAYTGQRHVWTDEIQATSMAAVFIPAVFIITAMTSKKSKGSPPPSNLSTD